MPHFGLMKTEDSFKTEWGALLRARLHIRSGRRRLLQGKIAAGILTLYDALLFAMQWYVFPEERKKKLQVREGEDLNDDKTLYSILARSGILDGKFDYIAFDELVEQALTDEMAGFRYSETLKGIESVMTQLGVMPFNESELPTEDPSTF